MVKVTLIFRSVCCLKSSDQRSLGGPVYPCESAHLLGFSLPQFPISPQMRQVPGRFMVKVPPIFRSVCCLALFTHFVEADVVHFLQPRPASLWLRAAVVVAPLRVDARSGIDDINAKIVHASKPRCKWYSLSTSATLWTAC